MKTKRSSEKFRFDALDWCLVCRKDESPTRAVALFFKAAGGKESLLGMKKKLYIEFKAKVGEPLKTAKRMERTAWYSSENASEGVYIIPHERLAREIRGDLVVFKVKVRILEEEADALPPPRVPFGSFLSSERLSDIALLVRGRRIPAHKVVLVANSPYFEALLTNGMRESGLREIALDCEPDAFLECLRFMYTLEATIASATQAIEILELADLYSLVPLRDRCFLFLRNHLDVDSVWSVWSLADKRACQRTIQACFAFVSQHFEEIVSRDVGRVQLDLLLTLLRSDDLRVASEEKVFHVVQAWAAHSGENAAALGQVLPLVRWPLLQSRFLRDVVERSEGIMAEPCMQGLLLEAYRCHAVQEELANPDNPRVKRRRTDT